MKWQPSLTIRQPPSSASPYQESGASGPALTRHSTSTGPARPANQSRTAPLNGLKRRLKPTVSLRPVSRWAATTSSSSAAESASGFSTNTCLPARRLSAASHACESCRVAITTAWILASASNSRGSLAQYSNPCRCPALAADSPPAEQIARSRTSATCRTAGISVPVAKFPAPIKPMPTGRAGPSLRARAGRSGTLRAHSAAAGYSNSTARGAGPDLPSSWSYARGASSNGTTVGARRVGRTCPVPSNRTNSARLRRSVQRTYPIG